MTSRRHEASQARDNVLDKLREEGLAVAYARGIRLLQDDKIPATAQASLVRIFLQAGGVLNVPEADILEKDPSEMSAAEIARATARIRAELAEIDAAAAADMFD